MDLTTAAGQSGFRPTRLLTATCEDAWFRCPSCRTDLLRLPWVLDLPGTTETVTIDVWPAGVRAPTSCRSCPGSGSGRSQRSSVERSVPPTPSPRTSTTRTPPPGRDLFVRTVPLL
ncbi:MAG: hypothetical protein IPF66_24430 [Holophagales bacterium]|nr:hypothetical protein [Holophagales bacterium]